MALVIYVALFSSCINEEKQHDYPYYSKYQMIERDPDGELKFVTQYLEIQSKDHTHFVRLGFSTTYKLLLECRTETENFEWFAYNNFWAILLIK